MTDIIRTFSCCSAVGNISNEPVQKYKRPDTKIKKVIIHKIIRMVFIPSPPDILYHVKGDGAILLYYYFLLYENPIQELLSEE